MTQMELRAVQDADMQSTAAVSTRADSSLNAEAIAPRRFAGRSQTAGRSREIRSTSPLARRKELAEERVRSLVTQARAGDDRAFEQLVKCYQSRIHSHVARMTQDPAEAEDLAQETFLRAYQALPHFRGDATFGTWLYRIASNLAIDAARHRRRREWQTVSLDEPIEAEEHTTAWDLADGGQRTPAETLESAALRGHVWDAIAELSPKLRSPIILYDLQGLTYEEIAGILGCPLGTVKSRLFNARCQLRAKLRQRLPEEFLADLVAPNLSAVFATTTT